MCSITYNLNYSSGESWEKKIKDALSVIESSPTGNLLISKINKLIKEGIGNVTIKTRDEFSQSRFPYPKITYYGGKHDINIIIPDVPYRSLVQVIDNKLIHRSIITDNNIDVSIRYLTHICNSLDVPENVANSETIKMNKDKYISALKTFCYDQEQPFEIILAHEMIHALRLLMEMDDERLEEEATIYGIKDLTLQVDSSYITENEIRKDLGHPLRVNHSGRMIS